MVSVRRGLSLECLEPLNLIRHTLWYVTSLWSNWITVEKTNSIENQHRALEVHGGVFLLPDKWSRPEKAFAGNVSFHKKAQGGWRWIFLQLCAFPQFSCLNFNHHYSRSLFMLRKKKMNQIFMDMIKNIDLSAPFSFMIPGQLQREVICPSFIPKIWQSWSIGKIVAGVVIIATINRDRR